MSTLKVAAINHPSASTGGLTISTGGIVTGGGLDYITSSSFTAASTVSVDGCFTANYENYRVLVSLVSTSASQGGWQIRLRAAGADNTAASYNSQETLSYSTTVNGNAYNGATYWNGGMPVSNSTSQKDTAILDFFAPALAAYTNMHTTNYGYQSNVATWVHRTSGHQHQVATAFDGFSLSIAGGYSITGTIIIYGYRKA